MRRIGKANKKPGEAGKKGGLRRGRLSFLRRGKKEENKSFVGPGTLDESNNYNRGNESVSQKERKALFARVGLDSDQPNSGGESVTSERAFLIYSPEYSSSEDDASSSGDEKPAARKPAPPSSNDPFAVLGEVDKKPAARSDAARSDAARSDAARSDAARSDAARSDNNLDDKSKKLIVKKYRKLIGKYKVDLNNPDYLSDLNKELNKALTNGVEATIDELSSFIHEISAQKNKKPLESKGERMSADSILMVGDDKPAPRSSAVIGGQAFYEVPWSGDLVYGMSEKAQQEIRAAARKPAAQKSAARKTTPNSTPKKLESGIADIARNIVDKKLEALEEAFDGLDMRGGYLSPEEAAQMDDFRAEREILKQYHGLLSKGNMGKIKEFEDEHPNFNLGNIRAQAAYDVDRPQAEEEEKYLGYVW